MKKKLAIIGYSTSTIDIYHEQIDCLFSDHIIVEKFYVDCANIKKGLKADLILVQSYNVFKMIRPYILKKSEIIFANRTISKAGLEKIMRIPEDTEVLLLDEDAEMATQMVSVIYQLGARHIELTPIYLGADVSAEGKVLIILGQSKYTPGFPKEIVNIGSSLLDISTVLDIAAKLGLFDILQRQNIQKSYKEIVTTDFGLSSLIGKTNRFESELDILLQVLDDSIIGVNAAGVIHTYNEGAEKIIGYKKEYMMYRYGLELLHDIPFKYVLENQKSVKENLIKINGYDVVVSVDPIIHSNRLYGAVAIIRKFNDIEKKQHKLRSQLIGKGLRAKYILQDILGESEAIKKCKKDSLKMAKSNSTVLITGESGTGKELFAQAIHNNSSRKEYQFVAVNCGALPESLLESELFGYEEGAFTGARKGGKPGLFELAHKGTLFLDEIGEISQNLQMRLLRVLQEREVMRIGGDRLINVDIRLIAATNKDLNQMVTKGEFREDLFYRLNVLRLKIPNLNSRREDILPLVNHFKMEFNGSFELDENVEKAFINHDWKGNVRELRNCVEHIISLEVKKVQIEDLPFECKEDLENNVFDDERSLFDRLIKIAGKNIKKYVFVLEELEKGFNENKRLGRRSIFEKSQERNMFISEQEIRTILINLEKYKMVEMFKGRTGTVITEFGRELLEYLK
ncbi:Transcriptional regulator containing PAS, AAA-type ATPase, and DNA-binding Fis domains [Geosporobacter subterraneus DSM 17957]|uniref:Transcriptional regulator containing PAS, AAA-type ATPase, and DNA-binding Fis domains n=1 Tax=Geosporobacter subterraneus DSM 17957 TaxID=1121919 RepID=A0A1M6K5F3_9FIRM|nr:sigma 54-interacting transcriptional regulator [Geosporobacter subterraneus]SHJ54161.1 Transcriptional regulator containing PAS, AAA-type ATPase, and DNA-binding Fis domains [Geosporobacter subterraneus DSM 17957]